MNKHKRLILIFILFVAFFLRFYRLGSYPALNADEAAIAYNAYSLIQTGNDEHGNSWPIHFQSFNDYKPGLYFYLVLPFVKFFGLNVWSVRIPGASLGVATVFILYLLIKELNFGNSFEIRNLKLEIGEIAAFFLAISPWHIHFSRGGWEVNVATFFILLGLYLLLKGFKNLPLLMLSLLSFGLAFYTYHAARIVVPLLELGLLVIYWNEVRDNLINFALAVLIGLVVISPLIKDFMKPNVLSRAAGVGLFADPGPLNRINEQRGEHGDYTSFTAKIFHNKATNYSLAFLENWGQHYWGEFLFLSGDSIQRDKVPETGEMYLIDLVFIVVGLISIFSLWNENKNHDRGWKVIIWWLLIAPTASALTFQSPHALRAENMVIPLIIISAYGATKVIEWGQRFHSRRMFFIYCSLLIVIVLWNFGLYQHNYWIHLSKQYPFSSQYGVKELVDYVVQNQDKYQDIIITQRYDQPYILFLFYMKYPPEKFQKEHILTPRDQYGFSTVTEFDKYHFQTIDFEDVRIKYPDSLIIGTDTEIPKEANIIQKVYGTNGHLYFDVVAN